jgi:hypothetical protein
LAPEDPSGSSALAAEQSRRRGAMLLGFAVVLMAFGWMVWRFNFVCDDAYISFRYSRNLAEGHGLRYNLNEDPPVEGYSNFLWVLLMTPIEALGWDVTLWARLFSVACGIALLWRLYRLLIVREELDVWIAAAAVAFVGITPTMAVWSTGGLATVPFALCVWLVFEWLVLGRGNRWNLAASAAGVALVLVRAEGFAWAGVLLGLAAVAALWERDRGRVRPLVTFAIVVAVVTGVMIGWRLWYFGDPVPNTAYAKSSMSAMTLERGWKYLATMYLTCLSLPVVLVAGLGVLAKNRGPVVWAALALVLGFDAYAVLVGGDFMAMGRFLAPSIPLMGVLLAKAMGALRGIPKMGVGLAGGLAAACIALSVLPAYDVHPVGFTIRQRFHFRWFDNPEEMRSEYEQWAKMKDRAEGWVRRGKALGLHTQPDESVIRVSIGAVGYYSRLHIYDQVGLVNREVGRRILDEPMRRSPGHDKFVPPSFFYKYGPTYLRERILEAPNRNAMRQYATTAFLAGLPRELAKGYPVRTFSLAGEAGFEDDEYLILAMRRDKHPRFQRDGRESR